MCVYVCKFRYEQIRNFESWNTTFTLMMMMRTLFSNSFIHKHFFLDFWFFFAFFLVEKKQIFFLYIIKFFFYRCFTTRNPSEVYCCLVRMFKHWPKQRKKNDKIKSPRLKWQKKMIISISRWCGSKEKKNESENSHTHTHTISILMNGEKKISNSSKKCTTFYLFIYFFLPLKKKKIHCWKPMKMWIPFQVCMMVSLM